MTFSCCAFLGASAETVSQTVLVFDVQDSFKECWSVILQDVLQLELF